MSPASSGQPRPAAAYALWLDSLHPGRLGGRAGRRAGAGGRRARPGQRRADRRALAVAPIRLLGDGRHRGPAAGLTVAATADATATDGSAVRLPAGTFEWIDTGDPMPAGADTVVMREWLLQQEDGSVLIVPGGLAAPRAARGPSPPRRRRRRDERGAAGQECPAGRQGLRRGRGDRSGRAADAAG